MIARKTKFDYSANLNRTYGHHELHLYVPIITIVIACGNTVYPITKDAINFHLICEEKCPGQQLLGIRDHPRKKVGRASM